MAAHLVVPARCCGPTASGNGGWTAGAAAGFAPHRPAAVRLLAPPPLEVELDLAVDGEGRVDVAHGTTAVAEVGPGAFEADAPAPVSPVVADEAATRYVGFVDHAFPRCLSCGPERAEGDGLRIFPGAIDPDDMGRVAAPFGAGALPASDLDDEGHLLEPLVWAALDCATGWPAIAQAGRPMVLGRMVAEVLAPVPPADLVVVGSAAGHDGRKHLGTSALYDADGQLLARAEGLWIELR